MCAHKLFFLFFFLTVFPPVLGHFSTKCNFRSNIDLVDCYLQFVISKFAQIFQLACRIAFSFPNDFLLSFHYLQVYCQGGSAAVRQSIRPVVLDCIGLPFFPCQPTTTSIFPSLFIATAVREQGYHFLPAYHRQGI